MFSTFFFFTGQFSMIFPAFLSPLADFVGVASHLNTLARAFGIFAISFISFQFILMFLYLTVQRLLSRRF